MSPQSERSQESEIERNPKKTEWLKAWGKGKENLTMSFLFSL